MGVALFAAGTILPVIAQRLNGGLPKLFDAFALTAAVPLIVSSIVASLVMPARTALVRDVRGEDDPPLGYPLVLVLLTLCAIGMLELPAVMNWAQGQLALVRSALPEGPDPEGFGYVPMTIALSVPVLTAMTIGLCGVTSVLAIVAPSKLAFRVISASVLLQLGYICAIVVTGTWTRTFASALASILSGDATASRVLADWAQRHDAAVAHAVPWIAWTSAGYIFAAAVAYVAPRRGEAIATPEPAIVPAATAPPGTLTQPHAFQPSAASAALDEPSYSVHPRMTLLESWFTRKCTNFEIRTIPRQSRKWFSFSWTTGALRQEPEGPDLVMLRPPRAPGVFLDRSYVVLDARTGEAVARFEPHGADWEIVDGSGRPLGRVLRESRVRGFVTYRAFVGDEEVVRYKWTLAGLSTSSAQLEIEFLSSPAEGLPSLDRVLAMAIAPVLEHRARLANERSMPSS